MNTINLHSIDELNYFQDYLDNNKVYDKNFYLIEYSYKDTLTNATEKPCLNNFIVKGSKTNKYFLKSNKINENDNIRHITGTLNESYVFFDRIWEVFNEIYPTNFSYSRIAKKVNVSKAWIARIFSYTSKCIPSKELLIKLIFAYKIPRETSNELISLAGYSLETGKKQDKFILICINNQVYSLENVKRAAEVLKYYDADFTFHPDYETEKDTINR